MVGNELQLAFIVEMYLIDWYSPYCCIDVDHGHWIMSRKKPKVIHLCFLPIVLRLPWMAKRSKFFKRQLIIHIRTRQTSVFGHLITWGEAREPTRNPEPFFGRWWWVLCSAMDLLDDESYMRESGEYCDSWENKRCYRQRKKMTDGLTVARRTISSSKVLGTVVCRGAWLPVPLSMVHDDDKSDSLPDFFFFVPGCQTSTVSRT